jgi:Putative beta-barrel porin-2, OmpL-like. bbp2
VFGFLSGYAAMAQAQTPDTPPGEQSPTATSIPPVAPAPVDRGILHFHFRSTDFSFLCDGYLDTNFNNPASDFNRLRAFDVRSDTAHFMPGMITIDHAGAPLGFHPDAGFGEMFHSIHAGTRDRRAWDYIKQAYVSFKPKSLHGIEIDAGEFATSAGAEVIETNQNYNDSRSLLFTRAIAYTHTGVRAQCAWGSHFTGNLQVLNGWNNLEPINRGKTLGFKGAYAWKRATWSQTYYVGPEHAGTTKGWRNLYDTNIAVNQSENLTWYLAFDYRHDKDIGPGSNTWTGIACAGALRYRQEIRHSGTPGVFRRRQGIHYRNRANRERIHSNPGVQADGLADLSRGIPNRLVEQALLREE